MHEHSSALIINFNIQLLLLILISQNIWIVDDSNGHNNTCYEELGNEGFTISILNSYRKGIKGQRANQN